MALFPTVSSPADKLLSSRSGLRVCLRVFVPCPTCCMAMFG